MEKDQRSRDRLIEEKNRIEDELRSTQINHEAAISVNKTTLLDHDKELKRLGHKEDVLKVNLCLNAQMHNRTISLLNVYFYKRNKLLSCKNK